MMENTTDSQLNTLTLSLSRTISAPIEQVFNAWINPETLAKFMIPVEGMCEPEVVCDAVEGGKFSIVMISGEQKLLHSGAYQKINPYKQIAFSWESAHSIDGSVVTLNFAKVDKGTLLQLEQVKFYDEEAKAAHAGGWTSILLHLEEQLLATI